MLSDDIIKQMGAAKSGRMVAMRDVLLHIAEAACYGPLPRDMAKMITEAESDEVAGLIVAAFVAGCVSEED